MALTLSQAQAHFKFFGKIIFMANKAPTDATAYKKAVMGTVRQGIDDGDETDYSVHGDVLVPMENSIKSTINALAGVPTQVKSSCDNYLRKVVSVDLGLAATAQPAVIAAELASQMDGTAHVGQSGTNPTGFAVYFTNNYATTLPQDADPNCLESWIDDDVI